MKHIEFLGFDPFYKNQINDTNLIPARVVKTERKYYTLDSGEATGLALLAGSYSRGKETLPVTGDWVLCRKIQHQSCCFQIDTTLTRKTSLSRKVPGNITVEQVLAANMDFIFLVFGLEGGRKCPVSGVERYLTMAWDSGAVPVVILNKSDLHPDPEEAKYELENSCPGVDIHTVSATEKEGLDPVRHYLTPGKTAVLVGPSGVGKSSLINALKNEEVFETGAIREKDKKGKHTTTRRELTLLEGGGILMDTPGLRELQLWADDDSLEESFSDILELAGNCRFSDCSHESEPGCAVQEALIEGALDERRFENYLKMKKELAYLKRKVDARAEKEFNNEWKRISKDIKKHYKNRGYK